MDLVLDPQENVDLGDENGNQNKRLYFRTRKPPRSRFCFKGVSVPPLLYFNVHHNSFSVKLIIMFSP